MMFELSVEREFCAAHAIVIDGEREPVHGHNWRVSVAIEGEELDENGLLVDFHDLERRIDRIIEPFDNADLNAQPPFDERNPTAEHVAQHIGESISADLPERVRLLRVTISEAPGCQATWRP
jgi:6-pyruvoyltetrahydropterin/6-carboxytetrahydropterin synthase